MAAVTQRQSITFLSFLFAILASINFITAPKFSAKKFDTSPGLSTNRNHNNIKTNTLTVFVFCLRQTTFHFPFSSNEAGIQNSFGIGFRRCKIRFVMEKGSYKVSGGLFSRLSKMTDFQLLMFILK